MFMLLQMHHLVLVSKVVFEINTLLVLQLNSLFLHLFNLLIVVIVRSESQQCSSIYCISRLSSVVHYVQMSLLLVLSLECNITFRLAIVIWTNEMRFCEVTLKRGVVAVIHVFV